LEVIIGSIVYLFRYLSRSKECWEFFHKLYHELLDLILSLLLNQRIVLIGLVRKILNGNTQLFLAQVRPLKNLLLLKLDLIRCQFLAWATLLDLHNRIHDMLLDIFDESLNEWSSHIIDATLQPNVIVQEVSLASQDRKINGKIVVFAIYYGHKTLFNLLGNV
jgi:hypothetical protein